MRRRFIIQYRAENRCEWCGAVNYIPHPDTGSKVVLTIAHVWGQAAAQRVATQLGGIVPTVSPQLGQAGSQLQAAAESYDSYSAGRPIAPAVVG